MTAIHDHAADLPIRLLHDRVLVLPKPEHGERRSATGIVIPATARTAKRLVWGEVVGVGNSVRAVQLRDRVLYDPEERAEVEVRGVDYVLLREREVHAVANERLEDGLTGLYL
jgi:chaperonin GroES